MENKIEGISPNMLWTFCVVLVGLMSLVVLIYKVVEIMRKEHDRKVQRQQLNGQDITDRIAEKVMNLLQPKLDEKFEEIDRKFAADKETLDLHTRQLNAQSGRVDQLDNDNKALLHGMSALLSHEVSGGNVEKLQKTQSAMNNYLIDRKYHEEDWQ